MVTTVEHERFHRIIGEYFLRKRKVVDDHKATVACFTFLELFAQALGLAMAVHALHRGDVAFNACTRLAFLGLYVEQFKDLIFSEFAVNKAPRDVL